MMKINKNGTTKLKTSFKNNLKYIQRIIKSIIMNRVRCCAITDIGGVQCSRFSKNVNGLCNQHNKFSMTCHICYENKTKNNFQIINCNHSFCKDCLNQWKISATEFPSCPICREPIILNIHEFYLFIGYCSFKNNFQILFPDEMYDNMAKQMLSDIGKQVLEFNNKFKSDIYYVTEMKIKQIISRENPLIPNNIFKLAVFLKIYV